MPSTRRLAVLALATAVAALFATAVVPAAGAPPPEPISAFEDGLGVGEYGPDYPATDVSNVTVDISVAANGSAAWTERATLTNPETVDTFHRNASLRRAVVERRFDYRFGKHTSDRRSKLVDDALVVTYRTDDRVTRGPGGGVVFGTLAPYRNNYYPGAATVTIRPPSGYGAVDYPSVFVDTGDHLRWDNSTGEGRAGVQGAVATFEPDDEPAPALRASLAHVAVYGPPTLRTAVGYTALFGVPLGLLVGGASAFAFRRRRAIVAAPAVAALVGVAAFVGQYPVLNRGFARYVLTNGAVYLGLPAAALAAAGVGLYAVAWRR